MKKLFIGKDFSDDPAGRYYTDGDGSGEEFREEVLKPIFLSLGENEKIIINIDEDVEGYGSSFLVEAFAGLIKHGYFSADDILRKMDLEYKDADFEFYARKVYQYINEARFNSEPYSSTKDKAIREHKFLNSINKDFLGKILK
jgi:hypothetical protein